MCVCVRMYESVHKILRDSLTQWQICRAIMFIRITRIRVADSGLIVIAFPQKHGQKNRLASIEKFCQRPCEGSPKCRRYSRSTSLVAHHTCFLSRSFTHVYLVKIKGQKCELTCQWLTQWDLNGPGKTRMLANGEVLARRESGGGWYCIVRGNRREVDRIE